MAGLSLTSSCFSHSLTFCFRWLSLGYIPPRTRKNRRSPAALTTSSFPAQCDAMIPTSPYQEFTFSCLPPLEMSPTLPFWPVIPATFPSASFRRVIMKLLRNAMAISRLGSKWKSRAMISQTLSSACESNWSRPIPPDFPAARQCFQAAQSLAPEDAALFYNIGQCYDRSGDAARAERNYRECLQRAPDHAECRHALNALLVRTGQRDQAAREVEGWLVRQPRLAAAYAEDAWLAAEVSFLTSGFSVIRKGRSASAIGTGATIRSTAPASSTDSAS